MIRVLQADITTLAVDVIVNAANSTLLGGSGVDGAIHRAAGPDLAAHCRKLGGCPTGDARITPGFKLPARYVIHTVGPVWQGGASHEAERLASCYHRSFELALQYQLRRIAFPSISTGAYGYPKDAAACIAISVMREYEPRFDEIVACCFGVADAELYRRLLASPAG